MCRYRTDCGSRSPAGKPMCGSPGRPTPPLPPPFLFANGELVDSASVTTAAAFFLCAVCHAHRHTMSTARGKAFRPLQLRVPLQSQEETFYYLDFFLARTHTSVLASTAKGNPQTQSFPFPSLPPSHCTRPLSSYCPHELFPPPSSAHSETNFGLIPSFYIGVRGGYTSQQACCLWRIPLFRGASRSWEGGSVTLD